MRKILFILIAALGLFCSNAMAENYWPRSYYVQAGVNAAISNGDLNERAFSLKDTTGALMKVYPPDLNLLVAPEIALGTNMRFFSLSINYSYATASTEQVGAAGNDEHDLSFWRFGFEFVYNFLWPEDFQIGLGLGYSFSTLKANRSAYLDELSYRTEYTGLGVAFIANVHYYFTEHIAIVPAVKVYENWFKSVYTGPSELCDLDPYLWQTFISASLSVQYQF